MNESRISASPIRATAGGTSGADERSRAGLDARLVELLAEQHGRWPVWRRGYVYGADVGRKSHRQDGMVATPERHLFLFEPIGSGKYGTAVPACTWTGATTTVVLDDERRLKNGDDIPRCALCLQAEPDKGGAPKPEQVVAEQEGQGRG